MSAGFDQIANEYDADFVNTATGKMQRNIVWDYLKKFLDKKDSLSILELNCGTGEDAIWLASKGHKVLATDVSEKMLEVANKKANASGFGESISFSILDISKPETYPKDIQFDIVFSNFGGFNCLSPDDFLKVLPAIAKILKPKGRLISVIMPKFCLWESFYFSLKGEFSKVFRRNRADSLAVQLGDNQVETWYFSPSQIQGLNPSAFRIIRKRPVGLFLPPSYLENYFAKHPKSLHFLNRVEKLFGSFSFTSSFSDHFIIDMEVQP